MAALILIVAAAALVFVAVSPPASAQPTAPTHPLIPKFSAAVAFDVSPPLRNVPVTKKHVADPSKLLEIRPERGPRAQSKGNKSGDKALQTAGISALAIPGPLANFEGLSNQDNLNIFGFRVNPPDPNGEVGPNNYVEIINLVFAVYDKNGNKLLGPIDTGSLWAGFAVPDCTDPSGDPVVLYDQLDDRWILTQFTTSGLSDPSKPFWNCVAVSTTGDPTGGDPNARVVSFFLDGNAPGMLPLVGDGLLPPDIDGKTKPANGAPAPLVGTQDDDATYGATFDALNIWELSVKWQANPIASIVLKTQLPVANFDSIFPCSPGSRDCLPQPGITDRQQYLDILSYRQRPTFRLAYRNFGTYESLVTNQSVEALPGVAGVRWYEIRRTGSTYTVFQQGTYAPNDGVHRWMGSVAMDKKGDIALGYSVVNGTNVYPGVRYTGRLAGDTLGQMTLGEGVIINGSGVQTNTNSRWGDYTDITIDPTDDCTFWYVNEYYQTTQPPPDRNWQTRIASFKLPGCQ